MKVRIKRIDKTLPLPEYKTAGAVAFDLASRVDIMILPQAIEHVPLNVAIEIPKGYMVMLAARSSLYKQGLRMINSVGIVDQDYCGNTDEYHAALQNFTDKPVTIKKGTRLVQGILKQHEKAEWDEVDDLDNNSRGGFGTTGII